MNTLPVPYHSQILQGALAHNQDCGPTSTLMLAQAYQLCLTMTVDQAYDAMQPAGDVPIAASQLQTWLAAKGLKNDWKPLVFNDLFNNLVNRKSMIALIHYAVWVDAGLTQKRSFRGAHFVVVTGMDIESMFIHDPYREDGSGTNQPIPIDVFMKSWQYASLDGNPACCALVPQLPIQDLSLPVPGIVDYNIILNGIYVHPIPDEHSPVLRVAWKGEIVHVVRIVGNYAEMADGAGYVWFPYLTQRT